MATTRDARPIPEPYTVTSHGNPRVQKMFGFPNIALTAADVTTINNVVILFTVPKGFTVTGQRFDVTKLDNGATGTISIGDATVTNRFVSAQSVQVAEAQYNNVLPAGVLGFRYTADTPIQMLVAAAATTPVAGTISYYLEGYIDA